MGLGTRPGGGRSRRRRRALWAGLLLCLCFGLVAGCGGGGSGVAGTGDGSTLTATYRDRGGSGVLVAGPGERLVARTALGAGSRPGRVIATLAQISDAHVLDEESPARAPVLDRLGAPFESTFRPQEALTAQVLTASVRAVDALGPDAVLVSGDLADNAQANELGWATRALGGGVIAPDSGARGYQGPQAAGEADPFFYRPDVDAPRLPGLLARAQRPFRSPGLRAPWYPVAGNHDLLLAGEAPREPSTEAVAVGDRALAARDPRALLPPGEPVDGGVGERDAPRLIDEAVADAAKAPTRRVAPDPERRLLSPPKAVARLRAASSLASGRAAPGDPRRLDYAVDVGREVRLVVLDTVRRAGGAGGVVDPAQLAWLQRTLATAGRRWVLIASHQPLDDSAVGRAVLDRAGRDPRVVAVLSGHTHRNRIRPRAGPAGGYWLVETGSLVDWPQQARALRLRATAGGGVDLETWMLDHDDTGPEGRLAMDARQLAFLDAQGGRPRRFAGVRADRNARLYKPAPR